VKHRLLVNVSRAEICPQNLNSLERQLKLNDLMTTYLTMLVGFSSGLLVFLSEMIMRFFNKRKDRIIREDGGRKIQVQPRGPQLRQGFGGEPSTSKTISPPPEYNEAIKTISSLQGRANGTIESYRQFNGRQYAVVRTETGTQLVPVRAPSAAIFNYQYAYSGY
jgi:glutamate receptor, ionotropic, invertebrate